MRKPILLKKSQAVALVLCLFGIIACRQDANILDVPVAENGVMDLSSWDFENNGPIDLNGKFRFFWEQLIDPEKVVTQLEAGSPGYIEVPKDWNAFVHKGKEIEGHGSGTYHLRIKLAYPQKNLAIKILDVGTAANLFINGHKLYSVGVVGPTSDTSAPGCNPQTVDIPSTGTELDLVVQMSNFFHRKGGIREKMVLGTRAQLDRADKIKIGYDFFLFGSILIMAFYHMGIFVLRRKSTSPLYIGLFCFLIALRILTTGEKLFTKILPGFSWEWLTKLEYSTFYLAVPAFILFVYSIFPNYFNLKAIRSMVLTGLLFAATLFIFPTRIFSHTLTAFQLFTCLIFLYPLFVLVKASLKRDVQSMVFLVGFLILFGTAVNDILYTENIVSVGNLVPFGLFIFILAQAFLLSLHYSKAYRTIEEQQVILTQTNLAYKKEIQERKQAEAEARASHERFLNVLDSIDADVYVSDMQTYEILFMNQHMKDSFASDFTGKVCFEVFREERKVCQHCKIDTLLDADGQPNGVYSWECQNPITRKWYINYDRAISWDNNRMVHMQVATDVTTRKQAEEKLKQVNEELENRVEERTADILKANQALRQEIKDRKRAEANARTAKKNAEIANRAKSEFLANMSHELRTPLNHIIGFTELVLDQHLGELNEVQSDYLNDVHDSSLHLLSLINDILDLSKIESGKLVLELSQTHIRDLLSSSMIMFKEKSMKHGIQLKVELDGIPDTIMADERKLKQVIYNLLSNAVKFTADGGQVSLEASSCTLNGTDIKGIHMRVTDNGIGLSNENLERIFNPFEQVEQSTSRRYQGTGLGLSLTRQLVELHGGSIWAESPGEGRGASFHVEIPQN